MGSLIRREFLGSRLVFTALCLTVIGIPYALIYLIESFVTVTEELDEPGQFLEEWRSGKRRLVERGKT